MTKRESPPIPHRSSPGYRAGVRIRDAAAVVVVRFDTDTPRVLMGRRHGGHTFMPDRVVFPGGRVDRADLALTHGGTLTPTTEQLLLQRMRGHPSPRRARSLALAAIREAFEETGILIGASATAKAATKADAWRRFLESGVVPDVRRLHFIARAITPPGHVRRYDARFFLADARAIAVSATPPTDELVAPAWLTFQEARSHELPMVTQFVLDIAESRLPELAGGTVNGPLPFSYFRHGRRIVDLLGRDA